MNGYRISGPGTQWNISHENNETLLFEAPQISLDIIANHEVSQKAKDLYPMVSLIGVI